MKGFTALTGLGLLAQALAQQAGTETAETHPKLTWRRCSGTTGGNCQTVNGEIVIDANWRWAHGLSGYENCYEGNEWTSQCSGNDDCAKNCAVEGVNYSGTYGISTSGDALTLQFVKEHEYGTNVGSRTYLMESSTKYQMFTLDNNELAFDVDLSTVECGMNSALYLVPMAPDGGMAAETNNNAGAKYGTGYCDAQCARDLKFIGGKGNYEGWQPSETDDAAGVGGMGACCAEIDVWESNKQSFALTPHACEDGGNTYHVCVEDECGGTYSDDRFAGKCDANGCDYNPYRVGNPEFYGPGKTLNTNSKFTVITRFARNALSQVFIQNGQVIEIPAPTIDGIDQFDAVLTPDFCTTVPEVFDDRNRFDEVGGFDTLNEALQMPMVLVMSIWADHHSNMLWLDSIYPPEKEGTPGAARGRCPQTGSTPDEVISQFPNAKVTWSNVRFGPIGSTYNLENPGTGGGTTPPPPTGGGGGGTVAKWGQCGGQGYTGPTACVSGSTCTSVNQWYSQCL